MIFFNDHPPPHVHVLLHGANLRVSLDQHPEVEMVCGRMTESEQRRAVWIVASSRDMLLASWRRVNP